MSSGVRVDTAAAATIELRHVKALATLNDPEHKVVVRSISLEYYGPNSMT